MAEELVVLVDDQNNECGTMEKSQVHTTQTPLHRGFSVFLFNSKHQVLITKRAITKKTFPGVWTNTVCGHPGPGESAVEAGRRRLQDELGITVDSLKEVLPYRYRFSDANGIVENEICPILIGTYDANPIPIPAEIAGWRWMNWSEFRMQSMRDAMIYSPWCKEEAKALEMAGFVPGVR